MEGRSVRGFWVLVILLTVGLFALLWKEYDEAREADLYADFDVETVTVKVKPGEIDLFDLIWQYNSIVFAQKEPEEYDRQAVIDWILEHNQGLRQIGLWRFQVSNATELIIPVFWPKDDQKLQEELLRDLQQRG